MYGGTLTDAYGYFWDGWEYVENLILTGGAALNGTGNLGNNRLTGNAGVNFLSGLSGTDTLFGAAGNDRLIGGSGPDSLTGGH